MKNNLFEITVGEKVQELQEIDSLINKQEEPAAPNEGTRGDHCPRPEIQIAYLVIQHKKEVLDNHFDIKEVMNETFT